MTRLSIQEVRRSRLAGEIARRLESAIHEGRLAPGDRLASERSLADQFGVSRPVLREALRALQERSLVRTRRGLGTFVRDLPTELVQARPEGWLQEHRTLVTEFYEARLLIEPEAAARAADRRPADGLLEMKQILQQAERLMPEGHATVFTGLDIDFHTCIAAMSGHELIRRMLAVIINPDTDLRRVLHRVPGHPEVAHRRHARIARTIEDGDAAAARRAMRDALRGTLHDVDVLLKGGGTARPSTPR